MAVTEMSIVNEVTHELCSDKRSRFLTNAERHSLAKEIGRKAEAAFREVLEREIDDALSDAVDLREDLSDAEQRGRVRTRELQDAVDDAWRDR